MTAVHAIAPTRLVVLSGCSGGGKSTLLAALAERGIATAEEPGRRVVREALASGGDALPWQVPERFAERVTDLAIADHDAALAQGGLTLFDRSLIDAEAWYRRTDRPLPDALVTALARCRYDRVVFMAPPWPELFATDAERRHGFDEAVAEYDALLEAYAARGHECLLLPRASVDERVAFVLAGLGIA
ncbi:MAG: AAA family ATPase [Bosea sp.]|nr:AAA family ATPase [Bosea sp. (in: a-proteobacteria)]